MARGATAGCWNCCAGANDRRWPWRAAPCFARLCATSGSQRSCLTSPLPSPSSAAGIASGTLQSSVRHAAPYLAPTRADHTRSANACAFVNSIDSPHFDVASDAYATARDLLTKHRSTVSRFLDAKYDTYFVQYMRLVRSQNYVTSTFKARPSVAVPGLQALRPHRFLLLCRASVA